MIHWLKNNLERWQEITLGCVAAIGVIMLVPVAGLWVSNLPTCEFGYWEGLLFTMKIVGFTAVFVMLIAICIAMFQD